MSQQWNEIDPRPGPGVCSLRSCVVVSAFIGLGFAMLVGALDGLSVFIRNRYEFTGYRQLFALPLWGTLLYALPGFVGGALAGLVFYPFLRRPLEGCDRRLRVVTTALATFVPFAAFVYGGKAMNCIVPGAALHPPKVFLILGWALLCAVGQRVLLVLLRRWTSSRREPAVFAMFGPGGAATLMGVLLVVAIVFYFIVRLPAVPTLPAKGEPPAKKPNIVLITMDTVRGDHLSCCGYPQPTTPHIDELAEEGALFPNVVSAAPWTLPSHASIFTSEYVRTHGANRKMYYLSEKAVTLAETLADAGYQTAGFAGGPNCKALFGLGQGFQHYDDQLDVRLSTRALDLALPQEIYERFDLPCPWFVDGERTAPEMNRRVFAWLQNRDKNRPFFLFINYFDAHEWYRWHRGITPKFDPSADKISHRDFIEALLFGRKLTEEEKKRLIARYDGEIAYLDDYMGRLFAELQRLGLLDKTIVAITSDHGESFSEHGHYSHGTALYDEQIMVPLVLRYPEAVPKGLKIEEQVSTIDIAPTLLELAGVDVPETMQGESLVGLLAGLREHRKEAFSENLMVSHDAQGAVYDQMEAVRTLRAKYIESTGKTELYDLKNDPQELTNIADQSNLAETFRAKLERWRKTYPKSNIAEGGIEADDQTLEQLRQTGYIQGPSTKPKK